MLIVGDAGVRIRPVADRFASEADSSISGSMPGIAGKAAGFFTAAFAAAGVGVGALLTKSIGDAVDLGENASKVAVVFGDNAAAVEEFASTASTALGQSRNQALEAAGTFGALFTGMGLGKDVAADLSTDLVTVASDMASFGNATPQEALDALRSGLIGEAEPLRRFGVLLNAASIEQEAIRLGLAQTGEELTDAAKAQATYSLVMAQTSIQQGDFQRTSAGLANQQRILGAQFTDVTTNLGGLFVPVLANAAGILTGSLMPGVLQLTGGLPALGSALGAVGDLVRAGFSGEGVDALVDSLEGPLAESIGRVSLQAGNMAGVFYDVFTGGRDNVDAFASGTLGALVTNVADAARSIAATFSGAWSSLTAGLGPVIGPLISTLTGAFSTIGATISAAFGGGGAGGGLATFASMIDGLVSRALPLIIDYFTRWAEVVQAAIPIIVTILQGLVPIISGVFAQIGPVLQSLLPIITTVAGVLASTLLAVLTALTPVIPPLVAAIGAVAAALAGGLLAVITALAPVLPVLAGAIGAIATALAGALAGALQAVIPILPTLAGVIATLATMLAGVLASALQTILPVLAALIPPLLQVSVVIVGALMGALQALLPVIPVLVGALLQLVMAALVPLLPILPLLANLLLTVISALAPLIPVVVQVVAMLIQLAVSALLPLVPVIGIVAGLITMLIGVLVPIIQVVVTIAGAFVTFAAQIIAVTGGLVSTVGQVFFGLIGVVTSIFGGIFAVVSGVWNSLFGFVSGIASNIASAISGAFSGVAGAVSSIFSGIAGGVSSAFSGVGGAIRGVVNGAIGIINSGIGFINSNLIATANNIPFVDIPNIPRIPRLHSGGTYWSGSPSGEGFAFLRDDETVVTPEDRDRAAALIVAATTGRPTGAAPVAPGQTPVTITNNITQQPGESGESLAARTSQATVWRLNGGITRTVGGEVLLP